MKTIQQNFPFIKIIALVLFLGLWSVQIAHAQELDPNKGDKLASRTSFVIGLGNNSTGGLPGLGLLVEKGLTQYATIGFYAGYDQWGSSFNTSLHEVTFGIRINGYILPLVSYFLEEDLDLNGLQPYIGVASGYSFFTSNLSTEIGGVYRTGGVVGTRYYLRNGIGLLGEIGLSAVGNYQLSVGLTFGGKK